MKLRLYQEAAVDALLKDATDGLCPIGVLPTGAGKTVVMRAIIEQWLRDHPEHQILVLAHRTRLLTQARERFEGSSPHGVAPRHGVAPLQGVGSPQGIPTLVVSAGMGMLDEAVPGSVTVASIQTISRLENRRDWDLVLVDEAHRVGSEEEGGLYAAFLRSLDKDPPIIGLTATPWRMVDNRHVPIYGAQSLFQKASCWIYPQELIAQGFLLAPEVVPVRYVLPTTGIQLSHGEVAAAEIGGYRSLDFTQRIQEILEKTEDCDHVLIFCDTIKEAEAVAEALGSACVLHGGHSEGARNAQIERFRQGAFRHLVNVDVFTEGLDVPEIDAIVLLRITQSVVRYLQMAGRGLRPFTVSQDTAVHQDNAVRQDQEEGKTLPSARTTCRILDYGQHMERLGPVDAARGENAMPLAWRKRRWQKRNDAETEFLPLSHGSDGTRDAPACIEPEAQFCMPLKALKVLPIRARNGKDFLLLRFQIDDPELFSNKTTVCKTTVSETAGCKPAVRRTLWLERKLHASDPSLQEMARRWSRISGVPVKKSYGTKEQDASLPMQMVNMLSLGQGFLDYAPFAIRVRWSERAERWMVDGWQWSGREHMRMEVGEERALNAWIQRTAGTQDAVEQTMRRFLYRLSRSGVLDLQDGLPEGLPAEKPLEKPQDATVGGVYNNSVPPERSQSPAVDAPATVNSAGSASAKNVPAGWDAPIPPPSFSPAAFGSPAGSSSPAKTMVFPPSLPPAWLSQSLAADRLADASPATGKQEIGSPQEVAPLLPVVEVSTAAKLEDSGDTGRDGRMRVPTEAGVS
ncbi:DEAD/DEAH box helicase family protein [Acidithiobacillus ferrooxidans]|uniref:DEAD/DEAH box helicase n=1 Tax=Acidithiobacillus ferrooxidans TaxID=920 RepID=UPI0021497D30|nr:DEAD/DEAH box helicase family protein [Acidithiobacillus ferrooxidans]MCR1347344.1 DEAD/DEAH box helicase family protein [Acidithiobacillus ferrooxidans]MCR1354795.1 DEAD/DEAH box helicase family protein [Acidithiobacillus ferrooxidans]